MIFRAGMGAEPYSGLALPLCKGNAERSSCVSAVDAGRVNTTQSTAQPENS